MAAAEIVFESFALAPESTRGTAIANPTYVINATGMLTPKEELYQASDRYGVRAEVTRTAIVKTWSEWEAEGAVDVNQLPQIMNGAVHAQATPTTPTNGVLTRLWTHTRTMTADSLKTFTLWWGDPNMQIWRGTYGFIEEFTISADTSGNDPVMLKFNGQSQAQTEIAAPTYPAIAVVDMLYPMGMQLWVDTGTIGTTAVTGRLISAELTCGTGMVPKYYAEGPGGTKTITKTGVAVSHPELKLVLEATDTTQIDQLLAGTALKIRVRMNGSLIESVTPDYYQYVQFDMWGRFTGASWGDYEGANRTVELTVVGEYNTTAGTDLILYIQNTKTAL